MVRPEFSVMAHGPIERAVELARLAESLGYRRCWVYDEGLASCDVYVTMTAIAAATESLEIGPGITNPYTRHVGTTAAAIAALDELSGGRAFLGIGAGGSLSLDPLAIARVRPLTATREAISACRRLFLGQTVTFEGSHVRLNNAALHHHREDMEIWLAGRGPKMLELGGSTCEGVQLDFIYKPHLGAVVERIRSAGRAVQRVGDSRPRVAYSTMLVTDDELMDVVKPHLTYRLADAPVAVKEAIGLTDAHVHEIYTAMASGLEAAAAHIRDEWAEQFVIAGTPAECAAELSRLCEQHQMESFIVPVLDDEPAEKLLRSGIEIMRMIV